MDESLTNRLAAIRQGLEENRAFLQAYLASSAADDKPAQEERIKKVLSLADEMGTILTELAAEDTPAEQPAAPAEEPLPTPEEDINLEYNTHTLGTPDGADNIEGDWSMDGETTDLVEEPVPEETAVEEAAEEPPAKEEKKAKKHKKGKKHKKDKKGKKH